MIKVFIDFDGTITRQDVGDAMFETFGGDISIDAVEQYREGKISARKCFERECEACGEVDRKALGEFLLQQTIDDSFPDFVQFCRTNDIDCCILIDGMDYYIRQILNNYNLSDVPFFSNILTLEPLNGKESVKFVPSFPYTDEICDRCASCKRNHMLTISADDDIIVYIGEGYSDRCPSRFADIVFAKDDLLRYCRKENIPCYEYTFFADIRHRLQGLLNDRQTGNHSAFKKRKQALLARHELLMGG